MRAYNSAGEQRFYAIFEAYFDLEHNTSKRYSEREYTLDRMLPLAEAAGNPQDALNIIHIAGTKGKGSTCHFLAALFSSAGKTSGLFASPHLVTVRERFQINGHLVDYDTLLRTAETYERELRRRNLVPTLFEIMTILALRLFADAGVDDAILETGIGGRLDATNFIPYPRCCAITPISFDHMQILGNSIEQIAAEKAGIIKPGIPVGIAPQPYAAADTVVRDRAASLGAPVFEPAANPETAPFCARHPLPPFLAENLSLALAIAKQLGTSPSPETFAPPDLRARCEIIRTTPLVVLDGAHNAESMRRLVEALQNRWPTTHWTVILGAVKGKDIRGMLRNIAPLDADFIFTHPHTQRESALNAMARESERQGLAPRVRLMPRLDCADQLPEADAYLFTGSFFTALIGEKLFNDNR